MGLLTRLKEDFTDITGLVRLQSSLKGIDGDMEELTPDVIEGVVDQNRDRVAFRFEGEVMTYGEFDALANRFAAWADAKGFATGDCVALFMENRPAYAAAWFGMMKAGVVCALINSNLSGDGLAHCIKVADAKAVITGEEQDELIASVDGRLEAGVTVHTLGGAVREGVEDLAAELEAQSDQRPPRDRRARLRGSDLALYVYTSGTTGLPKAGRLTHARTAGMMRTFILPTKLSSRDRVYVCLPMYHGTGGICGVGMALHTGASVVLRRKFSASGFWDDVADNKATVFVYIGELCRYLLNQPEHPKERAHKLRTGFGNGLRPEIWQDFLDRFDIPHLVEFYGSTEGNVSFVNMSGHVGAVGRIPKLFEKRLSRIAFARYDVDTQSVVRGEDGFVERAEVGEPGEALGQVGEEATAKFEGYSDKAATEKKILRDVFEKGDAWFRTGDLLRKDERGFIFFVDRLGDTFRWKGENVSTNEVAEIVSQAPGVATANVYGVQVPGTDGKAGMAALTLDPGTEPDLAAILHTAKGGLPPYAVPLFLRLQPEAETTGTMKYRKVDLVEEGMDPAKVDEPLYAYHPEHDAYVPLTAELHAKIAAGDVRY